MNDKAKTQIEIAKVCDEIKNLLLGKNEKYGNSALEPCRVFSKSSAVEQILVRIDDKLSRVQKGAGLIAGDEDVINDLIGYLVLLKIALKSDIKPNYNEVLDFNRYYLNEDVITFTNLSNPAFKAGDCQWDGTDIDHEPYIGTIQSRCPD